MASTVETVQFIVDQIQDAGEIRYRKMFGEYALYCDDKVVALICDDELFIKPTVPGRAYIRVLEEKPPYPQAKPYLFISGEFWDDRAYLTELIRITANNLPTSKKKK